MIVEKLQMVVGASHYLPKENKSRPRGEDAHLLYQRRQTIIVCDGVGGWALKGIDSGIYSRKLVEYSAFALKSQPKYDVNLKHTLEPLKKGHLGQVLLVSSLCQGTSCSTRMSVIADSWFSGIAKGVSSNQHNGKRVLISCSIGIMRMFLSLVNEVEVDVEAGDLVVAGTDGLLDNMFLSEIEKILQKTEGCYFRSSWHGKLHQLYKGIKVSRVSAIRSCCCRDRICRGVLNNKRSISKF